MKYRTLILYSLLPALFTSAGLSVAAENPNRSTQAAPPLNTKLNFDKVIQDASALLKTGRSAEACALLEPYEFEHAGEEAFDMLFGIAALDSGKPDKATFAFERVLATNPNSAAARMEMARAYYRLGDFPRAKTEFLAVLKQNPSDTARANIEHYLDEIAARDGSRPVRFSAYIEAGIGRDSNVNNATSQSQIYVDAWSSSATLDPSNIQSSDSYHAITTGGEMQYRGSGNWGMYAGADVRQRNYTTQKDFNVLNLNARAGVAYHTDSNQFKIGANSGQLSLNNTVNHKSSGTHADWLHTLNPANQIKLSAQLMQYRFADIAMQPNDYDLQILGLGWQHFINEGNTSTNISLYNGNEKDVSTILNPPAAPNGGRTDGAKNLNGMRIGMQAKVGNASVLFAQAGTQLGQYSRQNYWFQRIRTDRFSDVILGVAYQFGKLWSMRIQASYAVNESNIEIYSFNRTDVALSLRRDFR